MNMADEEKGSLSDNNIASFTALSDHTSESLSSDNEDKVASPAEDTENTSDSLISITGDNDTPSTAVTDNTDTTYTTISDKNETKPTTRTTDRDLRKKLAKAMSKVNDEVRLGTLPSLNAGVTKPAKRNRVEITAKHKREICVYKQYHPKTTYDELAKHCLGKWNLKIGRSTLSDIIRQKEKWLNITPDQEDLLRSRGGRHRKLETELVKWLANLRKCHPKLVFTDKFILDNARQIGSILNIDQSFSYSKGWLIKFKKRQGLNTKDGKEIARRLSLMEFDTGNSMDLSLLEGNETFARGGQYNDANSEANQSVVDESFPSVTHSWSFLGDYQNTKAAQTSEMSDSNPNSPPPDSMVIKQEVCSNDGDYGECNDTTRSGNMDVDLEGQGQNQWDPDSDIPDSLCVHPDGHGTDINGSFPVPVLSFRTRQGSAHPGTSCERSFEGQSLEFHEQKEKPFSVNTSNFVSVQEAKHCAIRCIRFFENHPDSGEHLDALWNVFHTLDSFPTVEMSRQTTINQYFKKK